MVIGAGGVQRVVIGAGGVQRVVIGAWDTACGDRGSVLAIDERRWDTECGCTGGGGREGTPFNGW